MGPAGGPPRNVPPAVEVGDRPHPSALRTAGTRPILGAMRKTILLATLVLAPGLAAAQISAHAGISIDLPVVLPQLVVVSPGIQVVPQVQHEVFFTNGFYWVRHDNGWYRSTSHRGGWVVVKPGKLPPGLAKMPPGKYKNWKPAKAQAKPAKHHADAGHGNGKGNGNNKH